jgi:hypothetical protein
LSIKTGPLPPAFQLLLRDMQAEPGGGMGFLHFRKVKRKGKQYVNVQVVEAKILVR